MNDEDKKLVEMYLKYRKRKIVIITIILIIFLMMLIIFSKNIYNYSKFYNTEKINEIKVMTQDDEVISEIKEEIIEETKEIEETEDSIINEEQNKQILQQENKNDTNIKNEIEEKKEDNIEKTNMKAKPNNKDFLFTDGYTMENVSQIAQDYLKSSGFSGECIPLKDSEGIYIGMKVIFY